MNATSELRKLNDELLARNQHLENLVQELTEQKERLAKADKENKFLRRLLKVVL